MNANIIESWINSLGKGHGILVENRLIPDLPLQELYPGRELLHIEPEPGLALSFWAESKRFETLFITLIATTPSSIGYKGELPKPFAHTMTQSGVRSSFGEPMASKGPTSMPKPMGATGGWDAYRLDALTHPNIKLVFKYTPAMQVKTLVFSLIDREHD